MRGGRLPVSCVWHRAYNPSHYRMRLMTEMCAGCPRGCTQPGQICTNKSYSWAGACGISVCLSMVSSRVAKGFAMLATCIFPGLARHLCIAGRARLCRGASRRRTRTREARPGRGHVGPVGEIRRGDRARPFHRHRRDQRQGRPARQEARAGRARRREQSRQGRDRGARAGAAREGRGAVRRPRHAGVAGDRAVRQPDQGAVHGRVGRRHADHAQRRGRELRLPRLGGRRTGRQGAGRLRGSTNTAPRSPA